MRRRCSSVKSRATSRTAKAIRSSGPRASCSTRRIHDKPTRYEVVACKPWLAAELELVDPDIIVVLDAASGGGVARARRAGAPHEPRAVLRGHRTRRRCVAPAVAQRHFGRGSVLPRQNPALLARVDARQLDHAIAMSPSCSAVCDRAEALSRSRERDGSAPRAWLPASAQPACAAAPRDARAWRARTATRSTATRAGARDGSLCCGAAKAPSPGACPGRPHMRARRRPGFAPRSCRAPAASAGHRHGGPSTIRSRSLVPASALRACPHARGRSPRARTRPPRCSAACLASAHASRAPPLPCRPCPAYRDAVHATFQLRRPFR